MAALAIASPPVSAVCVATGKSCGFSSSANDRLCCPGTVCGWGNACQPACRINNTLVQSGVKNPANRCQSCQPNVSTTRWSNLPGGTACGSSTSTVCDRPDSCDGSGTCRDNFEPATKVCRGAAAGGCDVAESCTGASAACPADGFAAETTPCGGASQDGVCDDDLADHCSGIDSTCVDAYIEPCEYCGDGLIQIARGESCDDGNHDPGDGCDAECQTEPFQTTAPVKISGALSCTTAVANAARKIAVDGSGTIMAVMQCGTAAYAVVSTDHGQTFSAPHDLSTEISDPAPTVSQVAVAAGPSRVGYVAIVVNTGAVYLRKTEDAGATWSAAALIGTATSTSSGLSLEAFNDDIFLGFSTTGGVLVARNYARGVGAFQPTTVTMSIAFFDLVYDIGLGTLAVCADTPTFHIRSSSDAGVSFAAEVNPPGSQYYSDWAIGNGHIFVAGTNLGSSGNATLLYSIPTSALATSASVSGLPLVTTAQTRTVAADSAGNAFVASQLNGGGVQLDRLAAGAASFDPFRTISATGGSPIVTALPGAEGAAVVYTVGSEVWVTVQAY